MLTKLNERDYILLENEGEGGWGGFCAVINEFCSNARVPLISLFCAVFACDFGDKSLLLLLL